MSEIILKNLYMNGNKVPLMIRNGEIIYRMYTKLVFSVDTDSITFESTGGTYTINITANDKWSMTIPEFVTASVISGTGNVSITISTTGETTDTELTGNIVITCNDKTHTISVKQKSPKPDFSTQYLTLEIASAGTIQFHRNVIYSVNNGEWITAPRYSNVSFNEGDNIRFKYIHTGNTRFEFVYQQNIIYNKVYGNVMSLLYGDDFVGKTSFPTGSANGLLSYLFNKFNGLSSAENLVLPATTLTSNCYQGMFQNCTSLTTPPALTATTLASNCYDNMFKNCTSLITAPELPATTLANYCYNGMFQGCTSLVTAPILPATTLADSCYYGMFQGCTSLVTAPILLATTLAEGCYNNMFNSCSSLNYIKCLATDKSANSCTSWWVYGVSTTGTFVKKSGVNWKTGKSGIPSGWTVEDAE